MATNQVGAQQTQGFSLPSPRKFKGSEQEKPSMQKLIANQVGDQFRFRPAGEAIEVKKADESGYWQSLGYMA